MRRNWHQGTRGDTGFVVREGGFSPPQAAVPSGRAVRRLKVKRQRQDFHHQPALSLVGTTDTIYHEELQTAYLRKHLHPGKKQQ